MTEPITIIIKTPIPHDVIPHCCGCWNINYNVEAQKLKAICNECGEIAEVNIQSQNNGKSVSERQIIVTITIHEEISPLDQKNDLSRYYDRTERIAREAREWLKIHLKEIENLYGGLWTTIKGDVRIELIKEEK